MLDGYYEGKQQSKVWVLSKEDLEMMYSNYFKGDITLVDMMIEQWHSQGWAWAGMC